MNTTSRVFTESLIDEVKKQVVFENGAASIVDPVFQIRRNRVNAEFCKTLIRLRKDPSLVDKLFNTIVGSQNPDGSWNEIHPNYNQPSALITAFIGEALLYRPKDCTKYFSSLEKAKKFVLLCEKKPGYFLKSDQYTADHLNVDASCGAFLALYGKIFSDQECLNAARRAAERICSNQVRGYYPYTTDQGSYTFPLNVPCIHYQGVTMYYLAKIHRILPEDWIRESLLKGAEWLASAQYPDGRFDWSKSGLMFAYHLSGAYAFAYASFRFVSRWNPVYYDRADRCLTQLLRNRSGIVLRWESDHWLNFPRSVLDAFIVSGIGGFPLKERMFRFGYGLYRETTRRRFDVKANDKIFNVLRSLFHIQASTIDPSNNYPDMFMTSEVMDCLSWAENSGDPT
jgi:hypothetical protein